MFGITLPEWNILAVPFGCVICKAHNINKCCFAIGKAITAKPWPNSSFGFERRLIGWRVHYVWRLMSSHTIATQHIMLEKSRANFMTFTIRLCAGAACIWIGPACVRNVNSMESQTHTTCAPKWSTFGIGGSDFMFISSSSLFLRV